VWFADRIDAALDDSARFIPLFNTNIRDNLETRVQNSHREGQRNLGADQCEDKFDLHCEDLLNDAEFVVVLKTIF
jgi:hypothetical protein